MFRLFRFSKFFYLLGSVVNGRHHKYRFLQDRKYLIFKCQLLSSFIQVNLSNFIGSNEATEVLTKNKGHISLPDQISKMHPVMKMIIILPV